MCKERRSLRQILCFCCFCVSFVHHQPGDLLGVNHGNHGRMLCLFVFYCYFNLCPSGSTLWRSHNPDVVFAKLVNRTLSWKLNWLSWKIQGWNFHFHVQNLVLEQMESRHESDTFWICSHQDCQSRLFPSHLSTVAWFRQLVILFITSLASFCSSWERGTRAGFAILWLFSAPINLDWVVWRAVISLSLTFVIFYLHVLWRWTTIDW